MFRVLSILAAVVAVAVSAAPVASASPVLPLHDFHFRVKAGPPKPPGLITRSGGEVFTEDVKAPARPRGILDTGMFEHEWVKAPPKPCGIRLGYTECEHTGVKAPRNRNAGSSFKEATGLDSTQDPVKFRASTKAKPKAPAGAKPKARNNGNGYTHTLEDAIIVSLTGRYGDGRFAGR